MSDERRVDGRHLDICVTKYREARKGKEGESDRGNALEGRRLLQQRKSPSGRWEEKGSCECAVCAREKYR
jgi:hypothetical protein